MSDFGTRADIRAAERITVHGEAVAITLTVESLSPTDKIAATIRGVVHQYGPEHGFKNAINHAVRRQWGPRYEVDSFITAGADVTIAVTALARSHGADTPHTSVEDASTWVSKADTVAESARRELSRRLRTGADALNIIVRAEWTPGPGIEHATDPPPTAELFFLHQRQARIASRLPSALRAATALLYLMAVAAVTALATHSTWPWIALLILAVIATPFVAAAATLLTSMRRLTTEIAAHSNRPIAPANASYPPTSATTAHPPTSATTPSPARPRTTPAHDPDPPPPGIVAL